MYFEIFTAIVNKKIINIGLLVFFLTIIFCVRMGLSIQDIFLRETDLLPGVTILMSFIALLSLKTIRNFSTDFINDNTENQDG